MNSTRMVRLAAAFAALAFTGSAYAAEPANDLSIAFLPIEATTAHAGTEAGGLSPSVATRLASKDATIRIAQGETKAGEKPADTAARLNVRFLFTGTMGGEGAFIAAIEVIDAKTGAVILKSSFFSDEDNIPTLPGEIASGLYSALKAVKL